MYTDDSLTMIHNKGIPLHFTLLSPETDLNLKAITMTTLEREGEGSKNPQTISICHNYEAKEKEINMCVSIFFFILRAAQGGAGMESKMKTQRNVFCFKF